MDIRVCQWGELDTNYQLPITNYQLPMGIHCCPSCYSQEISWGDDYINAFTCKECECQFPEWAIEVIYPNSAPSISSQSSSYEALIYPDWDDIPF